MAFRYDMRSKTPQQQIIVAKRDAENKLRQQEAAKREAERKTPDNNIFILAIDKDICPIQNNLIKKQCSDCKYCKGFMRYEGEQCIKCSYKVG